MNAKDKLRIFNTILYITLGTGAVGTTDRNILAMSTVVSTPASVTTVENVRLWSGARYIIQPDLSCSRTVSVSQCLSKHAKMWKQTTSCLEQIIEKLQFITLLTAICIVSYIENSKNDKGYIT